MLLCPEPSDYLIASLELSGNDFPHRSLSPLRNEAPWEKVDPGFNLNKDRINQSSFQVNLGHREDRAVLPRR